MYSIFFTLHINLQFGRLLFSLALKPLTVHPKVLPRGLHQLIRSEPRPVGPGLIDMLPRIKGPLVCGHQNQRGKLRRESNGIVEAALANNGMVRPPTASSLPSYSDGIRSRFFMIERFSIYRCASSSSPATNTQIEPFFAD